MSNVSWTSWINCFFTIFTDFFMQNSKGSLWFFSILFDFETITRFTSLFDHRNFVEAWLISNMPLCLYSISSLLFHRIYTVNEVKYLFSNCDQNHGMQTFISRGTATVFLRSKLMGLTSHMESNLKFGWWTVQHGNYFHWKILKRTTHSNIWSRNWIFFVRRRFDFGRCR